MEPRTKRLAIILIGLAVAVVIVVLTVNGASAATDPDPTVGTGASFTIQTNEVPVRGYAHCWQVEVDQQVKSRAGKVRAWPKMEAEWCAGANYQNVTALIYLRCGSRGGYFSYDSCKATHGKVGIGLSSVQTFGTWHYHWLVANIGTFDLSPDLTMQLWSNGGVTGTWSWQ